jgi:hypothetical protein
VVYQNQFRRVTVRQNPSRCNLAQFWNTTRFRLYSSEGTRIYLPGGGTIHFNYSQIAQASQEVCVNGQIAAGLPWQSIGSGVEAIAAQVTGWNRYNTDRSTFMILVRGLPAQGVFATDFTRARRYGRASSCGIARFSNTSSYNNENLGEFSYLINGVSFGSFNWSTLPVHEAPPLCRDGIIYHPG